MLFFSGVAVWVTRRLTTFQRRGSSAFIFYSAFISYSSEDEAFALRLHEALQQKGVRCWLDKHAIHPGDHIADSIDEAIRIYDKVLLCVSRKALASWWVDQELERAPCQGTTALGGAW